MSVDKSGNRIQQMFGLIAPRYDLMNHLLSANIDRRWRKKCVRMAECHSGPILDVCSGTGDLAIEYWKSTRPQVQVIGTDFCLPMLKIARQKVAKIGGQDRLQFLEADALHLPFPDDHFELVTVAFGLRNVANTNLALQEMTRVCRPGGRVVVLEFSMPPRQPMRALYGFYFNRIVPMTGRLLATNKAGWAYKYLPQSVQEFPQGEALAERFRDSGLEPELIKPLTLGIAHIYIGRKSAGTRQASRAAEQLAAP